VSPELSRRVGRLMLMHAVIALDLERHLAFVDAVTRADGFDDLPSWVREVVLAAEHEISRPGSTCDGQRRPGPWLT
jgi:hypothetical protein